MPSRAPTRWTPGASRMAFADGIDSGSGTMSMDPGTLPRRSRRNYRYRRSRGLVENRDAGLRAVYASPFSPHGDMSRATLFLSCFIYAYATIP